MANRFDRYVATEYVGMPVDYYQAALMGREKKAMDELELQKQQLQAYGQITPVGADAKALQQQILGGVRSRVAGVAKKDLRTQDALSMLHGIVNDPEAIMASRNFMQDVADYTKADKTYTDYVKENPNDVNALPFVKAMYNLGLQTGDPTKYKPGAFSGIGPFTKYYDWKKRYNEIAAQVKKSGFYKETPIAGDYIQGKGEEGVYEKQIHDAVMKQLSSDSDAVQQIQREMEYNAFKSNPTDPNAYFKNVQLGDVKYAKSQFDQIMRIKTDFNDPSRDKDLRAEFRQRFIDAGVPVPSKKEFDKAFGTYRMNTLKDANERLTDIQNRVLNIGNTDPRSYATNKFVETAVQGIAETHSSLFKKETLKGDSAAIAAKNRALRLWMHNDRKAQIDNAIAADANVRMSQDNIMKRGESYTAWNDPKIFKSTDMQGVNDDGTVSGAPEKEGFVEDMFKDIGSAFGFVDEKKRQAQQIERRKYETDKDYRQKVDQAKTVKAVTYLESNYGNVLGPAPMRNDIVGTQKYLAAGKKFMGDMKMKGQQVAPTIFHLDAFSGNGGRPAPINKNISESLSQAEHIYTAGGDGDEKTDLLKKNSYKVGSKEGLSLKDAIAETNSVALVTDSRFGNPAFRYELQTDKGLEVVYVEARPDYGGPISKVMETYNVTSNAHQNKQGAKVININTQQGSRPVVIETVAPSRTGEGGQTIYDSGAGGMQNFVYADPNHPVLQQFADQAMKDAKITSTQQLISYVNNAYTQYKNGNAKYQLDPKTNLITTPSGLKIPPMKYVRVDNPNLAGAEKYVLVAPDGLTIGNTKIGGSQSMNVRDFERMGIGNMITDPSMQMYRRFPPSLPKHLNTGSYFDTYDESDYVPEDPSDNQEP